MQKTLCIIGYGNQARAWAQNLKDSGYDITIVLRKDSSSIAVAKKDAFHTITFQNPELANHQNLAILTPDHTHLEVAKEISRFSPTKHTLIFAHGFSMSWTKLPELFPQFSLLLLAPKAIATELRNNYVAKKGLGGFYSVELGKNQTTERELLIQIGHDLGFTVGPIEVQALQETNADLWSEQSLLCGTLPYLALKSYQLARQKGIPKELAYFECWYEVKLIAEAMVTMGPKAFFDLISPNALMGSEWARKKIFSQDLNENFQQLWNDLENKNFEQFLHQTDPAITRQSVMDFWDNEELQQVHQSISPHLFRKKSDEKETQHQAN